MVATRKPSAFCLFVLRLRAVASKFDCGSIDYARVNLAIVCRVRFWRTDLLSAALHCAIAEGFRASYGRLRLQDGLAS